MHPPGMPISFGDGIITENFKPGAQVAKFSPLFDVMFLLWECGNLKEQ
jgi:hypothetical protein